ncbi:MAG: L-aspartate oxidase [Bacteroidales bacterium]
MKRYIFNKSPQSMPAKHYDVVIAGAGLAGLYTALLLDPKLSCAVLVKDRLRTCNSSLAQGGIAAVVSHNEDTFEQHLKDTLKAGGEVTNERRARFMIEKGPEEINALVDYGIIFDTDEKGNWYITTEGGHTKKRVLHCGGDATGEHIIDTLADKVMHLPNVDILEQQYLTDILLHEEQRVSGVVTHSHEGYQVLAAPRLLIATGGIGQVYLHTTNQEGITGDGIAAAIRAGVKCAHMEFVQFHPTAFYDPQTKQSAFLISEAVRGEGGILRNQDGEAFMHDRHPMKDLAPRDVVAREIFREINNSRQDHVFLDTTDHSSEFLSKRFPTIYKKCQEHGIDMAHDLIPVAPVQHYFMGGIHTNELAESNIEGLFASGEAACTGVHGANRLASNSLLECLVFSRQCANQINKNPGKPLPIPDIPVTNTTQKPGDTAAMQKQIKELMQNHGGIVRNEKGLRYALQQTEEIIHQLDKVTFNASDQTEVYNMAIVSREVLAAALKNTENMGAHYRDDVSETDQ